VINFCFREHHLHKNESDRMDIYTKNNTIRNCILIPVWLILYIIGIKRSRLVAKVVYTIHISPHIVLGFLFIHVSVIINNQKDMFVF
jgi:hypothetical protein